MGKSVRREVRRRMRIESAARKPGLPKVDPRAQDISGPLAHGAVIALGIEGLGEQRQQVVAFKA